jgi:hypothetical protein
MNCYVKTGIWLSSALVISGVVGSACHAPESVQVAGEQPSPVTSHSVSPGTWRRLRKRLIALRKELSPVKAYSYRISTVFHEGHRGNVVKARGAYAAMPPEKFRMQLVGPTGTTAMDVWIRGSQDRLEIPALQLIERNDAKERPGRPVAFFRWWMLRPLSGKLLQVAILADGYRYWLRAPDGSEIRLDEKPAAHELRLSRFRENSEEHIVARNAPCGDVVYTHKQAKIQVNVHCDGPGSVPNERVFADPDAALEPEHSGTQNPE